jgi:release factor glutamine methyltransferase
MTGAAAGTPRSIAQARRGLARRFRDAGLDTPDLDARILVGHALQLDHTALAAQADRRLSDQEDTAIEQLAQRRLKYEPVARIVGKKEFWGLPLRLNDDMLVPRPETETVIEAALAALGQRRHRPLRIADLDTGSGALLLALLSELPSAFGVGTDISLAALEGARTNAITLGFSSRASFVVCDHGSALGGGFDLVVANPPYIASADIAGLQAEVRNYDPRRALDGGADGLSAYRAIASDVHRILAPEGVLVLELGMGQLESVAALMKAAGLVPGLWQNDLAGVPRTLTVRTSLQA